MAKKSSNKMASRQAKLNKKKQKGKSNVFKESITSAREATVSSDSTKMETEDEIATPLQSEVSKKLLPQIIHKNERLSKSAMVVYSYVGAEVKRIGIIGSIILIVLFGLTFVLR